MKSTELLQLAESFYKKALWSSFAAQSLLKRAAELSEEAEQFDIKDEELFNQFESFMNTYEAFLRSIEPTPENMTAEGAENSGQLASTLNTRAERIFNNSYLKMDESKGYDEDFNPADLLTFVQRVIDDANSKVEDITGMKIDEATAMQYANMFNQIQEVSQEGKAEKWSAEKASKALQYRKNWLEKIRWASKHGKPGSREHDMWVNYIQGIRRRYQEIMEDPDKKAAYRDASRQRQRAWYGRSEKREEVVKEKARKIREQKEKGDFKGTLIKLKQNIPNIKSDIKKTLLAREIERLVKAASAAEKTTYKPYLDAIARAYQSGNKDAIKTAIKTLETALKDIVEQFEEIKRIVNIYSVVTEYREELKGFEGVMDKESLSESERAQLRNFIDRGQRIAAVPGLKPSTVGFLEQLVGMMIDHLSSAATGVRYEPEPSRIAPPKVRVESVDPETGEVTYEEMAEDEFKPSPHRRILRGHMSKKQRKEIIEKIGKKSNAQLAQEETVSQEAHDFAHKVFQQILSDLEKKMKDSI